MHFGSYGCWRCCVLWRAQQSVEKQGKRGLLAFYSLNLLHHIFTPCKVNVNVLVEIAN